MAIKVLILNSQIQKRIEIPNNFKLFKNTIASKPTLHDFHAIILDTNTVLSNEYWGVASSYLLDATSFTGDQLKGYGNEIKEQIETGGTTFLFCGKEQYYDNVLVNYSYNSNAKINLSNYFISPIDLGVTNGLGDTFYPNQELAKSYVPLVRKIPKEKITYECYFSKLPKGTKILGTNRAGFPIFAEISIGNGRLVVLPRFEDIDEAISILIADILPKMYQESDPLFMPAWLASFSSDFEKQTKTMVNEIDKAKRLLYTKDKILKKAVSLAFEKLGFSTAELPEGTNPDLEILDGKRKAIVEVKGHENRQSDRPDMLQLLGYSTEDENAEKGIFVSNSEFCKPPHERKRDAFTQGAITLGKNNQFSLLNSVDLFEITMLILQGKVRDEDKKKLQVKIMDGVGVVNLMEPLS